MPACTSRCGPLNPNSPPSTTSHPLYGDFNDDRVRDVLCINVKTATREVSGGRREWTNNLTAGHYNLVDFDGDGRDDALIVRNGSAPTWDLLQSGGAWFTQRLDALIGVNVTQGVCVANTDADGADEVILQRPDGNLCADFDLESGTFSLRPRASGR